MKATDKFKMMIVDGEIEIPKTTSELLLVIDRYSIASNFNVDVESKIEELKDSFISTHKTKSNGKPCCYISRIKNGMMNLSNKKFNDVFKALNGVDVTNHIIEQLIIEERIKLIGKKAYLTNQEQQS